ncbi:MAG: DUF4465 domain-containing protein [Alistipes sp.]|nr:DUF4465 domain-containing protein [Alistipes sp.]
MKKFLTFAVAALLGIAVQSCSYDDSALWEAMDEANEKIEQNSNDIATLSALVDALNKGKVIISTQTTDEGVELTFSDNSKVVIKNGANGKDGADGKDGENGKDGKDGKDGADGKDGTNGKDGADGEDGDSFFVSIVEDETTVTITLADGRVIVLPKANADKEEESNVRVLTFEDSDAKFTPYTLEYAGVTVNCWSDLIDTMQYGGSLLYGDMMTPHTYYWYDEGNTELAHSCTIPYWTGGHALSNYVIADYTTLPEGYYGWYELQLATPIGGNNGSANFCVHNGYVDGFNSGIYDAQLQGFAFVDGIERVIDHMYITNINYTLNSLTYGDGFCSAATESTYYKVIAYGYDLQDNLTGSAEFTLCQGRDIVDSWQKFDLSSLGKVAFVAFNFEASDDLKGSYGLNAPAYFAYDDVCVRFE